MSGASWSRPIPLGICNHDANPFRRPDNTSSKAKFILYKEMREPDRRQPNRSLAPAARKTAQVCFLPLPDFPLLLGC